MTSSSFYHSEYGGSSNELNASATHSIGGPMLLCLIELFS